MPTDGEVVVAEQLSLYSGPIAQFRDRIGSFAVSDPGPAGGAPTAIRGGWVQLSSSNRFHPSGVGWGSADCSASIILWLRTARAGIIASPLAFVSLTPTPDYFSG